MYCAGDAIASSVLDSPFIQQHNRIGCYVHAERLREVDTTAVLDALLARGGREGDNVVTLFALPAPPLSRLVIRGWYMNVWLHAGPHTRCYVPLVVDNDSNMKLLHLGETGTAGLAAGWWHVVMRCRGMASHAEVILSAKLLALQTQWTACAPCRPLASGNPARHTATKRPEKTVGQSTHHESGDKRVAITSHHADLLLS